jgi:hypothetical protein
MTTYYSATELTRLIEVAETVCDRGEGKPELVVLRQLKNWIGPAKEKRLNSGIEVSRCFIW